MRKFFLFGLGAAIGAALAHLFDPDRGRTRRARLADQTAARGRDAAESVKQTMEYQKGVMRGVAHDVSERFEDDEKYDDDTLLQKVRSEALGYWDGSDDIEIDIRNGVVEVRGSVDDPKARKQLLKLIQDVDGVTMIDDRVRVGQG